MANQATTITLPKSAIKQKQGIVIFDLEKYQVLEKELEEYRNKEKALRSLRDFNDLARWGRGFAKKKKITQKQVLEND